MRYPNYVARLTAEHASFIFEPGHREIGPLHNITILPDFPPWNMDWAVFFPDGKHAYLYERWFPSPVAKEGVRSHFSFHYGPTGPNFRKGGFPARDKTNYPADIRIDIDKNGPHLHFHGELPHIAQSQVIGLTIADMDPFDFMRAVLKHRETRCDFDTILKFKVIP